MCGCIAKVNKALVPHNSELLIPICLVGGPLPNRALVSTTRLATAKRGSKPPMLFAKFCPFCGVKYPEAKAPKKAKAEQ